jgi:hypothetical protein
MPEVGLSMLVTVAIAFRLLAGVAYIHAVTTGKAQPHIISWFFWGLTALIAFGVQLSQGVGSAAFVTLALGIGPVIVFALAIVKGLHRVKFSLVDKYCAVLTVLGLALWLFTKNPLAALWMSIAVDFVSSVPTIVKSYHRPYTERAFSYFLSMVSMVLTLASLRRWDAASALFPAYILGINLTFTTIISTKLGIRMHRIKRAWARLLQQRVAAPAVPEE